VIMGHTELKMQPTMRPDIKIKLSSFSLEIIVGCVFNSVGLIITR
jgi:hypothetical protein